MCAGGLSAGRILRFDCKFFLSWIHVLVTLLDVYFLHNQVWTPC